MVWKRVLKLLHRIATCHFCAFIVTNYEFRNRIIKSIMVNPKLRINVLKEFYIIQELGIYRYSGFLIT